MTLRQTLPTQSPSGLPLDDERLIYTGLVARDSSGNPRAGVLASSFAALVSGSSSGMVYQVAPFRAVTSRDGVGVEFVANDGSTTVATTTAPTANSRIDVIWVKAQFPLYGDPGVTAPTFGVTQGTPSPTPSKPSIPAGTLEIGSATVPSTATTTASSGVVIVRSGPFTSLAGGVVPFRNVGERDAWSPRPGQVGYLIDSAQLTTFDGAVWSGLDRARAWTAKKAAVQALTASTMTNVLSLDLPSWAPPGVYTVTTIGTTFVGTDVDRFTRVRVGSLELDGTSDAYNGHTGQAQYVKVHQFTHTGGAVTVYLDAQVNGGSPQAQPSCRIQVTYQGRA